MISGIQLVLKKSAYVFIGILILIAISYSTFLINSKLSAYVTVTLLYIILIIFFFYFLNYSKIKERKNKSLYAWLDILDGKTIFLENLYKNKNVENDLLQNMNNIYNELLEYTGKDIRKLRLLKVYFKSINNESPIDLFGKVFITFLFGIFAANLSNGKILSYFSGVSPHSLALSSDYLTTLNVIMVGRPGHIGLAFILSELFIDKKRTKLIEEVLEICIKELESS